MLTPYAKKGDFNQGFNQNNNLKKSELCHRQQKINETRARHTVGEQAETFEPFQIVLQYTTKRLHDESTLNWSLCLSDYW